MVNQAEPALTPEEEELETLLLADDAAPPLADFIRRISPHRPPPPHLAPVIAALERARYSPQQVLISMPPGHAKTTLVCHAIAWWLSMYPADTCSYSSYNEKQAMGPSVTARTLAMKAGVRISEETNNKTEWRTPEGGGLYASGLDGGLTGKRVKGLLFVDDPFKGPVDANSQGGRDAVWDWFQTVAMLRLEDASVFVIHTRWHEDDLIGRLSKLGGWTVVNLPAIAEEDDLIGREPGEALWPDMYPIEKLEAIREARGIFVFSALYQGSPRPRGGALFGEPRYYDPATTSFEGCAISISADPAASEKTSADWSVGLVLSIRGKGEERVGYVRHVYRRQVAIPTFVADLRSIQQTWGNAGIKVESVGGFKAVPQMLRALGLERIEEITPVGDKFTRAQPAAAAWNAGRLLVPSDAPPWLGPFLDEVLKFTGVKDAHDDQVDALSQGWNHPGEVSMADVPASAWANLARALGR
jgi:predicted phage terminase large subunit-like protein